jgi:hypothetical protein
MSWMQRLKRVFAIDIESCPDCGGKLRVMACIEDPSLIAKILGHVPNSGNSCFILLSVGRCGYQGSG